MDEEQRLELEVGDSETRFCVTPWCQLRARPDSYDSSPLPPIRLEPVEICHFCDQPTVPWAQLSDVDRFEIKTDAQSSRAARAAAAVFVLSLGLYFSHTWKLLFDRYYVSIAIEFSKVLMTVVGLYFQDTNYALEHWVELNSQNWLPDLVWSIGIILGSVGFTYGIRESVDSMSGMGSLPDLLVFAVCIAIVAAASVALHSWVMLLGVPILLFSVLSRILHFLTRGRAVAGYGLLLALCGLAMTLVAAPR